ncbi:MAG: hypothetical protein JGK17_15215 [Microcoleus sp. PH2017_10_PVI_O_A]|uniref:hypothetical protein n=1 Tax=unclassified Microcoleus TaxID=2642155 RepID=UPI001D63F925|nr:MULTISPECIES: hypothetical protein [unclassified Microcoleus]MCC3406908.1 hypothetical protein [Microcoleus sp. PH2017_10_PVI_O_A]MCC3461003.1 hypothetical protein [Microcoleus sp. PH2017_11_PCY_U_A]MCC3479522.1 hypothetical protein [Microcoleus sp. PH2017_12_PCY_D_A]MCC3529605.1 hypothetical protein [Microcoleus sp. PH2017_21_RUC_O_A]MCC3541729.1 hypothetical protein [Microcoleus sp. PH2017_22_RUC_O_B]
MWLLTLFTSLLSIRKKEEGRRKKEEGRGKKIYTTSSIASRILSFIRWLYLTGCYLSLIEIGFSSTCVQINLKFVSAALEEDRTNAVQVLDIYRQADVGA